MTVSFGYEKKQVLDALRKHFFSRREIRLLIIGINVFAILSAALYYFKIIQPLAFLLFSFLWFVLWLTIRIFLPYGIYKRSLTFKEHFTAQMDADGILLQTEHGNQRWSWGQFSMFTESLYFFHLYFNTRSFFLIPKDAFPDLTQQSGAREIFRKYIRWEKPD
jgi:hypothetical protein